MTKSKSKYYLQQINLFLLLMLFAFPIIPLRYSGILMIVFGLSCFINYFFVNRLKYKFDYVLIITLIFPLLYLTNYFLNPESFDSWFAFEKRISLFVMPILFSFTVINIKRHKLFLAYNLSVLVLSAGVLIYLLFFGINEEHLVGGQFYAIRTTIEEITLIHPTYFSLFVGFSFYIILNTLIKSKYHLLNSTLKLLHLFVLLIALILLASKMFFLSTFVIIPIIIIKSKLKTIYRIGMICFFYLLIILSVIFVPNLNQRLSELDFSKIEIPKNNEINSTNLRFGIYHCSIELLKENYILGLGTAKLQQELNNCYKSINVNELHKINYNTHNEYINIWLGLGLFGLLVFLLILFFSFRKSLANDEHFIFLLLFCIFCITENLLARQHGIFLFAIINYYFVFNKTKHLNPKIN